MIGVVLPCEEGFYILVETTAAVVADVDDDPLLLVVLAHHVGVDSNAHGTPWVYQHLKVGKVVGMPVAGTMTSVNWVTLLDPSVYFGIPAVGFRLFDGRYLENTQMEPDVVVPLDPNKVQQGIDTQIEKAVEVLRAETK